MRERSFLVFHDGYAYFEHRFGVEARGAIVLVDGARPSPARIAETGARCIFREPQFEPGLAATVAEGSDVAIGVLDPIGLDLEPGPDAYQALLRDLAASIPDCLSR